MTITDIGNLLLEFIAKTDRNFERLDKKIDGLEQRFDIKIESEIGNLAEATAKGFTEVHTRIDNLESDMQEGFLRVRKDIFSIKDTYATKAELDEVRRLL